MTSTSGSSEINLRKFYISNLNFWIHPIETENPPEGYKPNEWQKLDRIVYATIRMHLSESVYFRVQSCSTTFQL